VAGGGNLSGYALRRTTMPSKSEKQARFMRAAAHDKDFAERNNIPQKVAKEFVAEDKKVKERKGK